MKIDLAAIPQSEPRKITGDDLLSQINQYDIGDSASQERPSDARLILKTANLGVDFSFANPAYPDNEPSIVRFDGDNAIMVMLKGDSIRAQITHALQIKDAVDVAGLTNGVTPEFIRESLSQKGLLTKHAKEAYGPAPFEGQASRLVSNPLPGGNNPDERFEPIVTDSYAIGMRAPTVEQAYLIIADGVDGLALEGTESTMNIFNTLSDKAPTMMNGTTTTHEKLKPVAMLPQAIVMAVDSDGNTKPIQIATAKDSFNISKMPMVFLDAIGAVEDVRISAAKRTLPEVAPI